MTSQPTDVEGRSADNGAVLDSRNLTNSVSTIVLEAARRFAPEIQAGTDRVALFDGILGQRLRAACPAFAERAASEQPVLLVDNTFWKSAKEGMLVTDRAVYSSQHSRIPWEQVHRFGYAEPAGNQSVQFYINGKAWFLSDKLSRRNSRALAGMFDGIIDALRQAGQSIESEERAFVEKSGEVGILLVSDDAKPFRMDTRLLLATTPAGPVVFCANCGSTTIACEKGTLGKVLGGIGGALVGSLVGSMLGVGQLVGEAFVYTGAKKGAAGTGSILVCQVCGNRWKFHTRNLLDSAAALHPPTSLPSINAGALAQYELDYGRKLTALEAAIIDLWRARISDLRGKVAANTLFQFPDVPSRRLAKAEASFAKRLRGESELVLGLVDNSPFTIPRGEGMMFTTESVCWSSVYSDDEGRYDRFEPGSVTYRLLDPNRVDFRRFSWATSEQLVLGDQLRIKATLPSGAEALVRLCAFLREAALLYRVPTAAAPSADTPMAVPATTGDNATEYDGLYGRKLNAIETAIVGAWRTGVGKQETVFTHPDLPARKVNNAKAAYAAALADDPVLGLQDSTVLGSAKEGALFTLSGVYWQSVGSTRGSSALYREIDPDQINASGTKLRLGDKHELLLRGPAKVLTALANFLRVAAKLSARVEGTSSGPSDSPIKQVAPPQDSSAKAQARLQGPERMTNAGSGASLAGEEEEMLLLAAVLRGFLPQEDLFIAPNIPPKKLENGCAKCGVPASETIFALIDTTSFGSAKNCLLFGREGIYFHNDWSATTPGSFAIPYREFVARAVSKGSWCEIRFGPKECVDTAGSNMPTAKALAILCAVQKALQGCRRPGGSEGI